MPVPSLADRRIAVASAASPASGPVTPGRLVATVISAVLRAVAAVASGLLLVGGVALLLWAVTPGSASDATGLLGGGVVAFAAAHFLPVSIGGVPVTLHPLLLTVIAVAVIASSAGRARAVRGRALEALHGSVFAVSYAVLVQVATALLAPPRAADPAVLPPLCVAAVGVLLGIAWHRTAWNRWWHRGAPDWLRMGLRGGVASACLLLAAGAVAVGIGLATSFSDATAVASLTAPSAGDGFGLLLLCLAFLPNAVVAGVGYLSGAGFSLGAASFSPLAAHGADLPAIPLLAAAPDGSAVSRSALIAFAVPVAAGVMIAVIACRLLDTRRDRLVGSALAAVIAGLLVAGLAAVARGGVAGGAWETTGVSPLLAGGLIAGVLLVVASAWSAVSGLRTIAWAPARPARADGTGGDEDPGDAADDSDSDDADEDSDDADDAASGGDGDPGDAADDSDGAGSDSDGADEPYADVADDSQTDDPDQPETEPAEPADPEDSVTADPANDPADSVTAGSENAVTAGVHDDPRAPAESAHDPAGDDESFPDESGITDTAPDGADTERSDRRLPDAG